MAGRMAVGVRVPSHPRSRAKVECRDPAAGEGGRDHCNAVAGAPRRGNAKNTH